MADYSPYNQFTNPLNNYYLGSGPEYQFDLDPSLSFNRQGTAKVRPIIRKSTGYMYPMVPLMTNVAFALLGKAVPSGPWNGKPRRYNPESLFMTIGAVKEN